MRIYLAGQSAIDDKTIDEFIRNLKEKEIGKLFSFWMILRMEHNALTFERCLK